MTRVSGVRKTKLKGKTRNLSKIPSAVKRQRGTLKPETLKPPLREAKERSSLPERYGDPVLDWKLLARLVA